MPKADFRIVGDKIWFNGLEVATFDPWLRETVRMDVARELENHIAVDDCNGMIERLAELETMLGALPASSIVGATW